MADGDEDQAERVRRFRFRVVAPDGRELVSDVAQVRPPPKKGGEATLFRVTGIFIAAKGQKQGALKGESTRKGTEQQFAALSLDYELRSPRDAGGNASGRRQHSPVSVVKEWGAASPQLFQALVGNEVLETVDIDCHGRLENGEEGIVHRLKLKNASVTSIRQTGGGEAGARELEAIDFVFEELQHLSPDGGVLASDSGQASKA